MRTQNRRSQLDSKQYNSVGYFKQELLEYNNYKKRSGTWLYAFTRANV